MAQGLAPGADQAEAADRAVVRQIERQGRIDEVRARVDDEFVVPLERGAEERLGREEEDDLVERRGADGAGGLRREGDQRGRGGSQGATPSTMRSSSGLRSTSTSSASGSTATVTVEV